MQGSVIEALGAAMRVKITIANGRTEQSNFHDYPILRIEERRASMLGSLRSAPRSAGLASPGSLRSPRPS
jgi:isoquinoline 1-oxidoreductase beta subunit